ncbi:MAG TPA: hypothetical protein VHD56_04335 [Tepidisphaeraceae bacterium]|nr:hypothetical protein [Tepidisphaeraceae bacterium]
MEQPQQQLKNNLLRYLPWLAAALPALIPLWLISHDGVDLPYLDQWGSAYAEFYIKAHHGQLSFWDFTAQQNEHRMFVPKVIYYVLNSITHWNAFGEMILGWLIVCATSLNIAWLCRKATSFPIGPIVWGIANLMIFTPVQWENWTWGLGVINVLPIFFITSAMVVLSTSWNEWLRIGFAMALGTAATFSSGQGILVWPLLLPMAAWSGSLKELLAKKWFVLGWLGAFAFNIVLYNVGYIEPGRPPELRGYYVNPLLVVRFILAFLGNPLIHYAVWPPPTSASIAIGLVEFSLLLASSIYVGLVFFKQRDHAWCRPVVVLLMIGWYSVLSGLAASEFRARQGEWMSMSSRYATAALYLPAALAILIPVILARIRANLRDDSKYVWPVPQWAALAIFLAIYSIGWDRAFNNARFDGLMRLEGKAAVLFLRLFPNNPLLSEAVGPGAASRIPIAEELNAMGYIRPPLINTDVASELQNPTPPTMPPSSFGKIERAEKTHADQAILYGWAMLPQYHQRAHSVLLSYQDELNRPVIFAMGKMGYQRDDLVNSFDDSAYRDSGWLAPFNSAAIPAKLSETQILAWAVDAKTARIYRIDGDITFKR